MASQNQNVKYFFGEAFSGGIQYTPPTPTNITGWTIVLTIRKLNWSEPAGVVPQGVIVFTGSSVDGHIVITDALNGIFKVILSSTETQTMPIVGTPPGSGVYYYDIWRTDAGFEQVLAIGTWQPMAQARLTD